MADETSTLMLVPGKTDQELAADFRTRIREALVPVISIMDQANAAGMLIGWRIERNAFGKNFLLLIEINKSL